jgi:hypothetical protein
VVRALLGVSGDSPDRKEEGDTMIKRWLMAGVLALSVLLGGLFVASPASANTVYINGDVCDYGNTYCFIYACTSGVMQSDTAQVQEIFHGYYSNPSVNIWYYAGGDCYYGNIWVDSQTNIIQVVVWCSPDCYAVWVSAYY